MWGTSPSKAVASVVHLPLDLSHLSLLWVVHQQQFARPDNVPVHQLLERLTTSILWVCQGWYYNVGVSGVVLQ